MFEALIDWSYSFSMSMPSTPAPTISDDDSVASDDDADDLITPRSDDDDAMSDDATSTTDDDVGALTVSPTHAPVSEATATPTSAPAVSQGANGTDPNESTVPDVLGPRSVGGESSGGLGLAWIAVAIIGLAIIVMGSIWIVKRRQRLGKMTVAWPTPAAPTSESNEVQGSGSSLSSTSRLVEV